MLNPRAPYRRAPRGRRVRHSKKYISRDNKDQSRIDRISIFWYINTAFNVNHQLQGNDDAQAFALGSSRCRGPRHLCLSGSNRIHRLSRQRSLRLLRHRLSRQQLGCTPPAQRAQRQPFKRPGPYVSHLPGFITIPGGRPEGRPRPQAPERRPRDYHQIFCCQKRPFLYPLSMTPDKQDPRNGREDHRHTHVLCRA